MRTSSKAEWRSNPSNWLVADTGIEMIKTVIDEHPLKHKYWVTLNWVMSDYDWLQDNTTYEEHQQQVTSWLDYVASRQKTHLSAWCGGYLHWEKPHVHIHLLSEKPLKIQKAKEAWRHGSPHHQQIRDYEPDFTQKRSLDLEQSSVFYQYRYHRAFQGRQIHCPCKATQCRAGRCPYQQ